MTRKIKLIIINIMGVFILLVMIFVFVLDWFIDEDILDIMWEILGLLFLMVIWLFIFSYFVGNCIRKNKLKRINIKDYEIVKKFLNEKLQIEYPVDNSDDDFDDNVIYSSAYDYFSTIYDICDRFLKGTKKLYISKAEIVDDSNDIEINTEIKKLDLEAFNNEIKKIIEIIYKYYDNNGVWKKYEKKK